MRRKDNPCPVSYTHLCFKEGNLFLFECGSVLFSGCGVYVRSKIPESSLQPGITEVSIQKRIGFEFDNDPSRSVAFYIERLRVYGKILVDELFRTCLLYTSNR